MQFLKLTGIIVLLLLIGLSCDNRVDIFSARNAPPEILIKKAPYTDTFAISLEDTLISANQFYSLKMMIQDDQPLSTMRYNTSISQDDGTVHFTDSTVLFSNLIPGNYNIDIIVTDPYDRSATASLHLFVSDNLPPVPHITYELLQDGNYRINASKSYDPDGYIVNYHFDYGVSAFDFHEPIVERWADHIDLNGGVTLTLTDNEGLKSEPKFFPVE